MAKRRPFSGHQSIVLLLLPLLGLLLPNADAFLLPPIQFQRQVAAAAASAPRTRGAAVAAAVSRGRGDEAPAAVLLNRAAMLQGLVGGAVGGVLLAGSSRPALAVAAEEMMVNYESPSKVFSFDYPDSWVLAPKPLQTHQEEVRRREVLGC
jgi:hypothetical protein